MKPWDLPLRCDVCGRFIADADLESGAARHQVVAPDSHLTYETYETTCREHTEAV